jgi:DNA-binding CsgD family transcriptional regulator
MTTVSAARAAFARRDWRTAYDTLNPEREHLATADLELLAQAAWWLGDGPGAMDLGEELFHRLQEDEVADAAMVALHLSLMWGSRGDLQVSTAWLGRARRLLDEQPRGRVHGFLGYVANALELALERDPAAPAQEAEEMAAYASEHGDEELACLALAVRGMAAIRDGATGTGFDLLDEAMLTVLANRLDPVFAGDIFCTVIHLCDELDDLARMRAWTDALEHWATPLSHTFLYAGVTRLHQLQLRSAEGDWDAVETELGPRSESLVGLHGWLAAAGLHELGEVRRLRGDPPGARAAFERCRELGVEPQPGAAMLSHVSGRSREALDELRVALADGFPLGSSRLQLAAVEVALAVGERDYAARLADELEQKAERHDTDGLRARAAVARAMVLLVDGRPSDAAGLLEEALPTYRSQHHRLALARTHELLAAARSGEGRGAEAESELATARAIYDRLGAVAELERLAPRSLPGGLTPREAEVLARVAGGASNKDVAAALGISDKTVGRHLGNIFLKIGVTSRTAAAAWAREHRVLTG